MEFVVCFNRLFVPALTGFQQLFDLRCDETDSGVIWSLRVKLVHVYSACQGITYRIHQLDRSFSYWLKQNFNQSEALSDPYGISALFSQRRHFVGESCHGVGNVDCFLRLLIFQVWEPRILSLTHISLAERIVHVHVRVFILTLTVHVLPSSLVLSVTTELLGPSPA